MHTYMIRLFGPDSAASVVAALRRLQQRDVVIVLVHLPNPLGMQHQPAPTSRAQSLNLASSDISLPPPRAGARKNDF